MTTLRQTVICGILSASAATAWAAGPATSESEHDALRALVPVYEQAVAQGDPGRLKPYLDPDFTAVMLTADAIDAPAGVDAYWAKIRDLLGPDGKYRVKVNVAERALIDDTLAVARGTTDDTVDAKARHYDFHSQWTAVCRKGPDGWKLLRVQATLDPIYNPFVGTMVRRAAIIVGGIAGVIGLVAGLVIGAIAFRRRANGPVRP